MSEFIVTRLKRKLKRREPIVSITAYDYFTALLAIRRRPKPTRADPG